VISLKDSTTTTKKAKEYPQDPILFFLIPFETLQQQKKAPNSPSNNKDIKICVFTIPPTHNGRN